MFILIIQTKTRKRVVHVFTGCEVSCPLLFIAESRMIQYIYSIQYAFVYMYLLLSMHTVGTLTLIPLLLFTPHYHQ